MAVYMATEMVHFAHRTTTKVQFGLSYPGPPLLRGLDDFTVFYTAGRLARKGKFGALYDPSRIGTEILRDRGFQDPETAIQTDTAEPYYRYYNPPAWAILTAPLTLLSMKEAYVVAGVINLAAIACMAILIGRILGDRPLTFAFLALGMMSFDPTYATFQGGQQSVLLSLAVGVAFLSLQEGSPGRRGLWMALVLVKPHFFPFNAASLLRLDQRAWRTMFIVGVLVLVPFLLVGPAGIKDYLHITSTRAHLDTTKLPFATLVLSWPGFFAAWSRGDVSPYLVYAAAFVTLILFLIVLRRGDRFLLPMAAALATLIALPHSHIQDWFLLVPGAAFLMARPTHHALRFMNVCLLFLLYLAVNDWSGAFLRLMHSRSEIYWATPAAFVLLIWLVALPRVERMLEDRGFSSAAALPNPSPARG